MTGYQARRSLSVVHPSVFWMAIKPFRDMFVFRGRSRRTEVGAFALLCTLASGIDFNLIDDNNQATSMLRFAWSLLWQYPWISLFVRRLHDQGKSARWACVIGAIFVLLIGTLPFLPQSPSGSYTVTYFGAQFHPVGPLAIVHGLVGFAVALAAFGLCLAEGELGTNRYGPDPRLAAEPATEA